MKLLTGQYEEGWKLYESRRKAKATKSNYKLYDQPLWLGKESLQNKTLLVEAEQGLGDIIQFCRYIPMLENIEAKVILETPKALASIIKTIPSNFLIIEKGQSLGHFDYHIPIMSLPHAFNTTANNIPVSIPYLFSDKIKREYWNKKLSKKTKPRIGLVWSGSAAHKNDKNRSLLLKDLEPIVQLPFEYHSLQKEIRENDQPTLFEFKQIHQHQNELNDFSDTAALIDEMDLIITVDTSVAHLAGALGKNVWIILPYHPDYRWMLYRNDSPWYPTCTLFRKSKIDDWDETIEEIISKLKKKFQLNEEANYTNKHAAVKTDFTRWSNPTNLLPSWDERAIIAARWINSGTNVLDIGCGKMVLEKHLPIGCNYIPCDIVKRDERTNLLDLNDSVIPDQLLKNTDTITFLGVLEYLFDLDKLFNQLSLSGKTILCSYCGTERSRKLDRTNLGWVNDLNLKDFERMVSKHNMEIEKFEQIDSVQYLFKIKQKINKEEFIKSLPRVHVISYNNCGNFGDRLGYHLINEILPAEVIVSWSLLQPLTQIPKDIDLLILGIGNSLFGNLLNDDLIQSVKSAKNSIGIFGTQYRENLPTNKLNELLDSLSWWFARYEEDIQLYGGNRKNVSHLGDWLINAFPMTIGKEEILLNIGEEIWNELPLDRTIQNIQKHKKVISTRLHPLLCALTSAKVVGYIEQREMADKNIISGKFKSMLLDIFSKYYPEHETWEVDKSKVVSYKRKVRENTDQMKIYIRNLLGL